eukprot:1299062-Rhodomonas_salina.1
MATTVHMRYAMPGTGTSTRSLYAVWYSYRLAMRCAARFHSAMRGTDVGYGAMRRAVLKSAMVLPGAAGPLYEHPRPALAEGGTVLQLSTNATVPVRHEVPQLTSGATEPLSWCYHPLSAYCFVTFVANNCHSCAASYRSPAYPSPCGQVSAPPQAQPLAGVHVGLSRMTTASSSSLRSRSHFISALPRSGFPATGTLGSGHGRVTESLTHLSLSHVCGHVHWHNNTAKLESQGPGGAAAPGWIETQRQMGKRWNKRLSERERSSKNTVRKPHSRYKRRLRLAVLGNGSAEHVGAQSVT